MMVNDTLHTACFEDLKVLKVFKVKVDLRKAPHAPCPLLQALELVINALFQVRMVLGYQVGFCQGSGYCQGKQAQKP